MVHALQVMVTVNGIPSVCEGDIDGEDNCAFEYSSAATPTLTSITPGQGQYQVILTENFLNVLIY